MVEVGVVISLDEAKELTHVSVVSAARPLSRNCGRHLILVGVGQKGALASGERDLEAGAIEALLDAAGRAVVIAVGREPAEVACEIERRGAVGKEVERHVRRSAVAGAEVADDGAADHLWLRGVALLEIGVGEVDGLKAVEAEAVVVEDVGERRVRVVVFREAVALRVAVLAAEGVGVVALGGCAVAMG